MTDKINRFAHAIKMDLLRFAVSIGILFVAVLAICLVLSLPEIIGKLIYG